MASEGTVREAAFGELRGFKLKVVRGSLSGQPKTDESFIKDLVQTIAGMH